MYTLIVNDSLRFNIDRFSETFNKHLNRTTLHLSAEDEVTENLPLTSLSRLAKTIANEGLLSMSIVVNGVSIWESSDYELEDASLSLQKRSYMEEDVEVEKDVIVSSLSFSCASPIVEEEE